MEKPRILIIDDDARNLKLVQEFMSPRYRTEAFQDPREGVARATKAPLPAAIILDVDMPGMNGFEVCEAIRAADPQATTSILFMSSDSKAASMQKALSLGANDYLVKPIRMGDLLSRIELRLGQAHGDAPLRCGNLVLEPGAGIAEIESGGKRKAFRVSDKGLKIFSILLKNEGRVVTREQILDYAWSGGEASDRSVDLHIFRLRKLLRGWDHKIESVYGKGYSVMKR